VHLGLEVGVFVHFLLDEDDGLGGDVAAVVVEAVELSEKGEEGVAHAAAQLVVVAGETELLMTLLEVGDFRHLPLEIGAVFEEVAFVELVELVPYLPTAAGHL
jgi:hypothetical protein